MLPLLRDSPLAHKRKAFPLADIVELPDGYVVVYQSNLI